MASKVVIIKTSPNTVLSDYRRLLHLAEYENYISKYKDTILKLNLSWNKFFPASNTPPWQLEAVITTLLEDGFVKEKLFPVENKTVVTDPIQGAKQNLWLPILKRSGLRFFPLTDVEWTRYDFKSEFLKLNQIFPKGFEIPKMFIGKQIMHLPTVKTHGHSVTTGAIKNSFGGLLKEFRHYAHKYIHEVLVDLMLIQKELHPSMFAVVDGTVCGDGAGPRTMTPVIKNYILASADQVAIDAVAAKMMGFNPMEIPYLRMCHERGLGKAD
ncbi:MAG: iron-sulfur cluster-binding protein, partial [candidate division Zixibacteria bacterium RBG_16_40_9]